MTLPRTTTDLADAELRGAVLCIGNFDGVHLGHRMLLARMRALAEALHRPAAVITFFPPARVLFEGSTYLMTPEEKLLVLAEFKPSVVVNLTFDKAFAATRKEVWLGELAALEPAAIVVGEDFRFGNARRGDVTDLRAITNHLDAFTLLEVDGAPVKSSRIRALLAEGDVAGAAHLLGEPYLVRGAVLRGQQRGRSIGYPTANLAVAPGKALPSGVFAVRATVGIETFGGMANVGARPTFAEEPPALEVHLFDFNGDLYGSTIDVRFVERLRGQVRFAGIDELRAQLAADEVAARRLLAV